MTFRSARGPLPAPALQSVRDEILAGHGQGYDLAFGVLMPDHAHLMVRPREERPGRWWDLAVILKGIKGRSARRVNQVLGTEGRVWQKESFDRIVRDEREYEEKWRYMYENPPRAGLVRDPDDYPWFLQAPPESDP